MIGIFDSGLGGLSAAAALRRLLPHADILYFGDTARNPYGTRSPDVIRLYAEDALRFLTENGASYALAACGTVSAVALASLRKTAKIPLFGVIEPAVSALENARHVAVLATEASVRSHAYRDRILCRFPSVRVTELACPFFVPMVENGLTDARDPLVQALVAREVAPLRSDPPDTVLLGCTHFPVLKSSIAAVFPSASVISAGDAAANALAACLPDTEKHQGGRLSIYLTCKPHSFPRVARPFLKDASDYRLLTAGFDTDGRIIPLKM